MLSAPTSANWARLNAVRIGMWRRSSSSTTPGPTIAGEHQLGRVGEEQAGDERHLGERQRQRAVAEVDVDDEHLGGRERERQRPPRQPQIAGRRLEMAHDQHKQDRRHGGHGGDQCPDRSVRAEAREETRRATLSPLRGEALPLDAVPLHAVPLHARPAAAGPAAAEQVAQAADGDREAAAAGAVQSTARRAEALGAGRRARSASAAATSIAPSPTARRVAGQRAGVVAQRGLELVGRPVAVALRAAAPRRRRRRRRPARCRCRAGASSPTRPCEDWSMNEPGTR